jgi:hypothetical protein
VNAALVKTTAAINKAAVALRPMVSALVSGTRRSGVGFDRSEQHCEEEPRQQSEDERSARAELGELVCNVSRDHVGGHEPAKCPGWWVRDRPKTYNRSPLSPTQP